MDRRPTEKLLIALELRETGLSLGPSMSGILETTSTKLFTSTQLEPHPLIKPHRQSISPVSLVLVHLLVNR